ANWLHDTQLPVQGRSQHTPSTQLWLMHSVGLMHSWPIPSVGLRSPKSVPERSPLAGPRSPPALALMSPPAGSAPFFQQHSRTAHENPGGRPPPTPQASPPLVSLGAQPVKATPSPSPKAMANARSEVEGKVASACPLVFDVETDDEAARAERRHADAEED